MAVDKAELEVLIKLNDMISQKLGGIVKGFENTGKATEGLTRKLDVAAKSFESIANKGKSLMKIGSTILGSLAAPTIAATGFEEKMADIRKVVDFETPEQFKQMGNDILDLSKKIPVAATGLADIAAAAGQFGIPRQEILEFSETAAKMSVAFDMTAGASGEAMAKIRAAMGISQKEVVDLADAINHLSNNTASSASDLVEFMQRTGGVGKIAGVAKQDLAALGATFVSMGSAPEVAARATNEFIMTLSTATSNNSKQFHEALAALKIDASDLEKKMKVDPKGTILEFLQRVRNSGDALGVLSRLFGSGWADDIAKIVNGVDEYQKNLGLVGEKAKYAGSMQKEFGARLETTKTGMQLTWNSLTAISTQVGTLLLPKINELLEKVRAFLGPISEWIEKNKELTAAIAYWTAGLGGASVAIGGITYVIGKLGAGVVSLVDDIRKISKSFGAVVSFVAANPIVLGVAAVAAAAALIVTHWEEIRTKFEAVSAAITEKWEALCGRFGAWWQEIGKGAEEAYEKIIDPFRRAFKWLTDKLDEISKLWSKFLSTLGLGGPEKTPEEAQAQAAADWAAYSGFPQTEGTPPQAKARGGIVSGPEIALIGEAGPEAVIPLSAGMRPRGLALLQDAAARLGVPIRQQAAGMIFQGMPSDGDKKPLEFSELPKSESGVSATFSPSISVTINIDGSGDPQATANRVREQVQSVFRDQRDEFMRTLERCMARERRLAF